jgi:hypothetical protein
MDRIFYRPENKKPFIHIRDEEFSPRYHPNYVFKLERSNVQTCQRHFVAVTGIPGVDYSIHQHSLSCEKQASSVFLTGIPVRCR